MSMKTYYELKDMLCSELDKFNKMSEINPQSLDKIDKLTHSIKSLETIIAMNEADDGESNYYPYPMRSYENMGGQSNARRRDSRGRYSRENREGYSRDEARDEMLSDLRDMMRDTHDERMKSKIQRFISEIENS